MPRLVALEWDNAEARVAVARVRAGLVELEHALSVPLVAGEGRTPRELGENIAAALKAVGVNGGDALVAVGRANIELRFLTVPPVPAAELPDLVRMQALRQFSQPIEEGLIDFAPLAASGDPPTSVLAAALTADQLKTIREVCEAAKLTPKHLVLRPFAADSLVTDRLAPNACVLTVDRLTEEVDLTVVLGDQAVFPRSVRIGNYGTPEEQASTIVAEIRRTIAASQNQVAGNRVTSIYIFGSEAEQQLLAEAVRRELGLQVVVVDPLAVSGVSTPAGAQLPAGIGRFAPLIGALLDESKSRRHEIDFLAPRKRPEAPNRNRLYTLIGTTVGIAMLAVMGAVYWQLSGLSAEIARLEDEGRKHDKAIKSAKTVVEHAALLDEYAAGQVVWLDELKELSLELPPADQIIVHDLIGDVSNAGDSRLVVGGAAHESEHIAQLEAKLRDERHRVSGSGRTEVPEEKRYPWTFRETITVTPPLAASGPPPATKRTTSTSAATRRTP